MGELTDRNGFILNGSPACKTKRGLLPWHIGTILLGLLSEGRTAVGHSSLDRCPWHCAISRLAFRPATFAMNFRFLLSVQHLLYSTATETNPRDISPPHPHTTFSLPPCLIILPSILAKRALGWLAWTRDTVGQSSLTSHVAREALIIFNVHVGSVKLKDTMRYE
jgi:hypothetical protein